MKLLETRLLIASLISASTMAGLWLISVMLFDADKASAAVVAICCSVAMTFMVWEEMANDGYKCLVCGGTHEEDR